MSDVETRRLELLDECLSQIQAGEASVSECLEAYPEHQDFLKPHLMIAFQMRDLLAPPHPSEGYIEQSKIRLLNRIRAQQPKHTRPKTEKARRRSWVMRPAFAYIALAIAFIGIVSGVGVASASASALPGDALYNVKLGIEETRLAFSLDPASDAELLIQFASTRLEEVSALSETSRNDDVELALLGYEETISRLIDLSISDEITEDPEVLDKIHYGLEHHQDVLLRVMAKASLSADKGLKNALQNAMERSIHGKKVIETIQGGGSPRDLAPGQQDKDKEKDKQGGPPDNRGEGHNSDWIPGPPPTKTPKPKNK
jgi:hypothetical protein